MPVLLQIQIDNVKCESCGKMIHHGLSAIRGVKAVIVDIDKGLVSVVADQNRGTVVREKLAAMGFPEKGSLHGLDAGIANAKSYVTCAIGHFS